MASKRILVVDDEQDIVELVGMRLSSHDFEVLTANDGQEGLNIARREKPDLVILDIMLPKIDGYKVCRMLKFDEKYKTIPILMFTARAQHTDEKMAMDCGADAYMTKPYDPEKLLAKIKELIGNK